MSSQIQTQPAKIEIECFPHERRFVSAMRLYYAWISIGETGLANKLLFTLSQYPGNDAIINQILEKYAVIKIKAV